MQPRRLPSISTPIILASIAVPLAIALLVGWTLVFARKLTEGEDFQANVWLLAGGLVASVTIASVLVMFAVFLGREIMEVRRQDSFIDSVTHELKSPLASIKLGLQTLKRPGVTEEKRESLRTMMLSDVDRLTAFIDDILQASRLAHDRDRAGLTLSAVNLRELVEDYTQNICDNHHIPEERIRIAVRPGLSFVTDHAALGVVVRNLLDNAVKYSGETIEIDVAAEIDARGRLILEVADRGIGIPESDLKRVFERFYRVPSEGVRTRRGTGLGLFVVWALVRNLGGSVSAASRNEGKGTTMRVCLPSKPKG